MKSWYVLMTNGTLTVGTLQGFLDQQLRSLSLSGEVQSKILTVLMHLHKLLVCLSLFDTTALAYYFHARLDPTQEGLQDVLHNLQ
jgi:hypothetical protein